MILTSKQRAQSKIARTILGYTPAPPGGVPMDAQEWETEDNGLIFVLEKNDEGQIEFLLENNADSENDEEEAGREWILAFDLDGIDEIIGILAKVRAAAVANNMIKTAPKEEDDSEEEEDEET